MGESRYATDEDRQREERLVTAPTGHAVDVPAIVGSLGTTDPLGLLWATIRGTVDPMHAIERVADQALLMIDDARGASIEFVDKRGRLVSAYSRGVFDVGPGRTTSRTGLGALAISSRTLQHCVDARHDDRVNKAQCRRLGICSLLCVPLIHAEVPLGVLKVCSPLPYAFDQRHEHLLDQLADFVASVIASAFALGDATERLLGPLAEAAPEPVLSHFVANVLQPGLSTTCADRERIAAIIDEQRFSIVVQPVVDLATFRAVGFEALTRFHGATESPTEVFGRAHEIGIGVELELAVLRAALDLRGGLPPDTYLAVNIGAEVLADPRVADVFGGPLPDVVVEVTEQAPTADYPTTLSAIDALRRSGARIAVDDTGAGFASLSHLLRVRPDIVKVDRELTLGIDRDPVRQALATGLVTFCEAAGSSIVAEGIEQIAQVATLRELGVTHGQGYFFARPGPSAIFFDRAGLWNPSSHTYGTSLSDD